MEFCFSDTELQNPHTDIDLNDNILADDLGY